MGRSIILFNLKSPSDCSDCFEFHRRVSDLGQHHPFRCAIAASTTPLVGEAARFCCAPDLRFIQIDVAGCASFSASRQVRVHPWG
jgi:hypothetical protein